MGWAGVPGVGRRGRERVGRVHRFLGWVSQRDHRAWPRVLLSGAGYAPGG